MAHQAPPAADLKMLDAGASKEAPFVLEVDGSSGESEEAQPYVYPPHLDGLRTHGDEVDVNSILAVAELQWPTSAFLGVIGLCWLKGSRPEPALTDLLVLVPWTYAGVIVIDGYHVPYYKRRLGLL